MLKVTSARKMFFAILQLLTCNRWISVSFSRYLDFRDFDEFTNFNIYDVIRYITALIVSLEYCVVLKDCVTIKLCNLW